MSWREVVGGVIFGGVGFALLVGFWYVIWLLDGGRGWDDD